MDRVKNNMKVAHIVIILFVFLSSVRYCDSKFLVTSDGGSSPNVQIHTTANEVELDNGILQVTFAIPEGYISKISYNGLPNLLQFDLHQHIRGYWDIEATTYLDNDGLSEQYLLPGSRFQVINHTHDRVEISFLCLATRTHPIQVDKRYVMVRGSSGFYPYAIFERKQGLPPMHIGEIRTVFRLDGRRFRYMAISDKIQREMPTEQDRATGEHLAYKEAVRLTNPSNPDFKGEVDDKYQYASTNNENRLNGWISYDPPIGFWIITPSDEFRMGGPLKQDLTSHVGPTLLAMFHSGHYVGKDATMSFKSGEPWRKVFGPYFVHLNSLSHKQDARALWQKAKDQMLEEVRNWPYDFPLSEHFPKANQRGSALGKLLVNDRSKEPVAAASAWVGLAAPGVVGSWMTEMKGYQFWNQTDSDGKFLINKVHAGTYRLYAWVPGFIGDYISTTNVTIKPGEQVHLGALVYVPPRSGPTLWEIGIPDRTAAEFFIPDPSPNLTNRVFLHDELNKYRQYGLWDRYSNLYRDHDLVYTVGKSDYQKDWFFAHVIRRINNTYHPATWEIVFHMETVMPDIDYTIQLALASANLAELQVRINNRDLKSRPLFTTGLIGRDNAIARHGIHGLYRLYTIKISSRLLHLGTNSFYFTQSRYNGFIGIMYDYLRLEGPPS